jgi:hypothetical protein
MKPPCRVRVARTKRDETGNTPLSGSSLDPATPWRPSSVRRLGSIPEQEKNQPKDGEDRPYIVEMEAPTELSRTGCGGRPASQDKLSG